MADIAGKAVRIYISDGADPDNWLLIGAARTDSLTLSNPPVESNHKDAGGWRTTFPGGVIKAADLSVTAEWKDTTAHQRARTVAMSTVSTSTNFVFLFGDGQALSGEFEITSFEFNGETEGPATFSMSCGSNGAVTLGASPIV